MKYCVRDDDPGDYGEYQMSFNNPNRGTYWKGDLLDNGACTTKEWPIVDIQKGENTFQAWEEDSFSWSRFVTKFHVSVRDNEGSCEKIEKTMVVKSLDGVANDQVIFKIWGV